MELHSSINADWVRSKFIFRCSAIASSGQSQWCVHTWTSSSGNQPATNANENQFPNESILNKSNSVVPQENMDVIFAIGIQPLLVHRIKLKHSLITKNINVFLMPFVVYHKEP